MKRTEYRWMNNCTGELYRNILHAVRTVVSDMIHYSECRTIKMLNVVRI